MKLNTIVFAASLTFVSAGVMASTYEKVEFDQIVQQSDTAVVAKKISSSQIKKNGAIYTQTKFEIIDSGFGFNEKEIIVETMGGSLNHMKYTVSQAGSNSILFLKNQPVLLMLNKNNDGSYQLTQAQQGLYPINKNQVMPANKGGVVSIEDAIELVRNIQAAPKD